MKIRNSCSHMSYRHFQLVVELYFISYTQCLLLLSGTDYIFDHLTSSGDIVEVVNAHAQSILTLISKFPRSKKIILQSHLN